MNVNRLLKNKTDEEQALVLVDLLVGKGLPEAQAQVEAADWLLSLKRDREVIQAKDKEPVFTQSPQWDRIREGMEKLKDERQSKEHPAKPESPPG